MATITYLDRFLEPLTESLSREVAERIVNLRATPEVQARADELARKANDGTLTPAEDAEYKDFVEALDVMSIIQAKARRFLSRQGSGMEPSVRDFVRRRADDRCEYCLLP
jgi:hypothetical protein